MKEEAIEKAAEEYANKQGDFGAEWYHAVEDFAAGAEWRINSVWHDVNENPDKNQLVLFEYRKTYGRGYSVNFGENYALMKNVILKWAYIDDLIPDRKEAEK